MFLVASEELKLQPLSLSYKQTFHNGKDTTLQEYSFEERGLFPSPLEFGSLFETYETCALSIYYLFWWRLPRLFPDIFGPFHCDGLPRDIDAIVWAKTSGMEHCVLWPLKLSIVWCLRFDPQLSINHDARKIKPIPSYLLSTNGPAILKLTRVLTSVLSITLTHISPSFFAWFLQLLPKWHNLVSFICFINAYCSLAAVRADLARDLP